MLSRGLHRSVVESLGGKHQVSLIGEVTATVPLLSLILGNLLIAAIAWPFGSWWIAHRSGAAYRDALAIFGTRGWLWGVVPIAWEGLRIAATVLQWNDLTLLLNASCPLWFAVAAAGWAATFWQLASRPVTVLSDHPPPRFRIPISVWVAVGVYFVAFTAMNWSLYWNLLVPHGDSAMYEEHLWNLLHGKGFRSYLDNGRLFLGEHIQVIHLLLLPLYALWPSHLLLELCESLALASGACAVFWIAARHTQSRKAATCLAIAYLAYAPVQFLDIAIDFKTFRPIAFGVPLLLFGIDQMERGHRGRMSLLFLLALSAKEDYAIILAPLGVWIFLFGPTGRGWRLTGGLFAFLSTAYLLLVLKVAIPWFRDGAEVHYVGYFDKFGTTLTEVATNILGNPALLFSELLTTQTVMYALLLLIPLACLPLLSPTRLAVALPLFGLLCLNQIAQDPRHHFHAPLLPVIFWAAAAGINRFHFPRSRATESSRSFAGRVSCCCALASGAFFTIGPLSIAFWDPHSAYHWRTNYERTERAKRFASVIEQIPKTARVFSTDFVHPRFTHYERSYDYSDYPRSSDAERKSPLPGEEYFIVIDTQHRYSKIKTPQDIPEYRDHPDEWERLPDDTEGYFIVLRRRQ